MRSPNGYNSEGTVYFPIVFHLHQPIGNFPWVIEDAYQKSYLPLLTAIENNPGIKTNIHITGPLLEYLKEKHPEYLEKIKKLNDQKQIEIVGGAFYEAILAILPEEDRIKQLQMTIDWWKTNYQITPRGMWLAERVYIPDLPKTLASLNIQFTFIDDYLFNLAGFSEEVPINEPIRYLVPWKEVSKTIKYLEKGRDPSGEQIIVMISDAEKMGVWPGGDRTTHDICYVSGYDGKKGWIYSFFEEIIQTPWIKSTLISEYLKSHSPRGLIYLP
ncbi:MAG: glycoside hydrolase family 38 N-terminal domain-containing protein, partial [Candidatus Hodarchaeales archaeon]